MRVRRALSSGWVLAPDLGANAIVDAAGPKPPGAGWRPVVVPGHWQVQFPDLARATGPVWYRLEFDLETSWSEADALVVEFGAVAHYCQGWLNGQYLGDHEGGHLRFEWSMDGAWRVGANELLVRVVTPSGDCGRFAAFPFEETLHGKQSWYGPAGGIWQEVAIEARSDHAIDSVRVDPDPDRGTVHVRSTVASGRDEVELRVRILDPDGVEVARADGGVPGAALLVDLTGASLRRWAPESPVLYRAEVAAVVDGRVLDVIQKRFGFRTFVAERGRFLLNGRPFFMRGVLDQDYHDSPGVAPSTDWLIERFREVKALGFNTLRCHIKVPDPRYLDAADEVGLLVWAELPTTSRLTDRARERVEGTLTAMIERDRHHPSLVIWSIANEAWGFDLDGNPEHRSWLHAMYHRVKAEVPDRLVVDNSPCTPNFHIETDIEDYHFYAVIPELRAKWDDFLAAFVSRAEFTFSPHGDARRTGDEPLVVSEFGAWGLPDLSYLTEIEPWWFETGQEWAGGAAYVHGALQRYALWHLDTTFGSWGELCAETQRRQFETMRYQIESMLVRPEIAGFVVTELSDVHWEANGLFDMRGRPRRFLDRLPELNQATGLVCQVGKPVLWDGDTTEVRVTLVNGAEELSGVEVHCSLEDGPTAVVSVDQAIGPLARHTVRPFDMTPAGGGEPVVRVIDCSARVDGRVAAGTRQQVLVIPRLGPQLERDQPVAVRDWDLGLRLGELGYEVTDRVDAAALRIRRRLDADDCSFVAGGGRVLLLAEDRHAMGPGFGEFPPIDLVPWDEALHGGGEWVSAFSWLRRTGRFADLPGGPMMDWSFEGLTPDVVIKGIPPARFEYDVLAGVFVGWVHQVAALVARHQAGLGSVLISTLDVLDGARSSQPMATWLLHQLIATAWEQP